MLYPFLIIDTGTGSLDSLPSEDIADGVVAEAFEAGKMDMRIFSGKRPGVELDPVPLKEVVAVLRRLVRCAGELSVAGDIDPAQDDLSSVAVDELAVLDCQPQWCHVARTFTSQSSNAELGKAEVLVMVVGS